MASGSDQADRLLTLARFSTAPEAEMVRELLSNNGIECIVQGANYAALEPLPRTGGFSEVRLLVRSADLSRAQDLYDAFFVSEEAALDETDDPTAEQE